MANKALPIPSITEALNHPISFAMDFALWRNWSREWMRWHMQNRDRLEDMLSREEVNYLIHEYLKGPGQNTIAFKDTVEWLKQNDQKEFFLVFLSTLMRTLISITAFEKECMQGHIQADATQSAGMREVRSRAQLNKKPEERRPIIFVSIRDAYELTFCYLIRLKSDFESQIGRPMRPEQYDSLVRQFYPHVVREASSSRKENVMLEFWFQGPHKVFGFHKRSDGNVRLEVLYPTRKQRRALQKRINTTIPEEEVGLQAGRVDPHGHFGCPALQA